VVLGQKVALSQKVALQKVALGQKVTQSHCTLTAQAGQCSGTQRIRGHAHTRIRGHARTWIRGHAQAAWGCGGSRTHQL